MKRKLVVALIASATVTLASTGIVLASNGVQNVNINSTSENSNEMMNQKGMVWVVDKEAVYGTVHHPEEGHIEYINHPEEGHTMHHEAEGRYELHYICNRCGEDLGTTQDSVDKHGVWHLNQGETSGFHSESVWIETKPAWDEYIVDKEAWTEEKYVVDKEAWDEEVLVSPEEGHWEYIDDTEVPKEPEKPEHPEEPEQPEEPDQPEESEKPEQPEEPEKPETPEQPEESDKPEEPDQSEITEKPTKPEVSDKNDNAKEESATPKTGDASNFMYLASLMGSGLVGATTLRYKKRK